MTTRQFNCLAGPVVHETRGLAFHIAPLDARHIQPCLEMQEQILARLPLTNGRQTYLHPKNAGDYHRILTGHGMLLGAFENASGRLAAQAIIRCPTTQIQDADVADMILPGAPENCSALEGIMTTPLYQGHSLMRAMIRSWLAVMDEMNRRHALAIVTRENFYSWRVFLQAGFLITGAGFDASDGSTIYHLHRDRRALPFPERYEERAIAPSLPLEEARQLFADGYIGVAFQAPDRLVLRRPLP